MKNIKINLLSKYNVIIPFTLVCGLQLSPAMADNINYDLSKNWSVGINTIYSKNGFKTNYGENIFSAKPALGLNPFVRQMFNDHYGIEAGFEVYKNIKRTVVVDANNIVAGVFIPPGIVYQAYRTKIKHTHAYLGGVAKITFLGGNNSLNLMFGASLSKLNAKYNIFQVGFAPAAPCDITRTFKKSKLIPIVKATFEHKLNSNFSVQALTVWKGMSAFKVKSKENPNAPTEIKLKNSLGLGLGVTYNI